VYDEVLVFIKAIENTGNNSDPVLRSIRPFVQTRVIWPLINCPIKSGSWCELLINYLPRAALSFPR